MHFKFFFSSNHTSKFSVDDANWYLMKVGLPTTQARNQEVVDHLRATTFQRYTDQMTGIFNFRSITILHLFASCHFALCNIRLCYRLIC